MRDLVVILLIAAFIVGGCSLPPEKDQQSPTVLEEDYLQKLQQLTGDFLDIPESLVEETEAIEQDVVSYSVAGNDLTNHIILTDDANDLSFAKEQEEHERLWQLFSTIIPLENRKMVKEFVLFTDGPDNTLGLVEPLPTDTTQWKLAIDYQDTSNIKDFYYTLIHEYGHLLTLNHSEVPPTSKTVLDDEEFEEATAECKTYYALQGCSSNDSYMYLYFKRFWEVRYEEWLEMDVESSEEAQSAFFDKHADEFLTPYAVSHPEEDIAESWVHFIFTEKPKEPFTIAHEKIVFFYNYPELVQLRKTILKNLYDSLK